MPFSIPIHDPVLIFAIVMLIVLLAPLLAQKMKMPGIVGLLFMGVIIGPHVLGLLERDKTIELLGTVGLLYIMFIAGLEIDIGQVKKNRNYSISFGLITFTIPLLIGTASGYYILNMSVMSSILLASMFSSHTLISYPIISKMALTKQKAVTTTIGGTIITDTLAMLILAIVVGANNGELNLLFLIKLFGLIALYAVATIFLLPKIASWFFKHFSSERGIEDYVFVIAALFVCSYFSILAGLEPIIGAFLTGLTLNNLIPEKSLLMNRINFVGNSLFIPFFLISVGMIVHPQLIFSDFETIIFSVVITSLLIFGKWFAAYLTSKVLKFNNNEKNLIFGLSVSHAAATLAVVLVGYRVGLFNDSILTGTITIIIVTCFISPLVTSSAAKKILITSADETDFQPSGLLNRILIPLKNPATLNNLIEFAILAHPQKSRDALYPLNIVMEGKNIEDQIIKGENLLTKAVGIISAHGFPVVPLTKIDINVPSAILKTIQEFRISQVVFGWNDTNNFRKHIIDDMIEQFVQSSNEMIYICRFVQPMNTIRRIVLLIPPLINKQKGFKSTFQNIKNLTSSINAKLLIFSEKETEDAIRRELISSKNIVKIDFIEVISWKKIIKHMESKVRNSDLVVQLIARTGRLAWRMEFDRLPNKLKNNFGGNNIIVVYPFVHTDEDALQLDFLSNEIKLLKGILPNNFAFNKTVSTFTEAMDYFINRDLESPVCEKAISQLLESANDFPLELTEDIVLVHTRLSEVTDFYIYICVNENGFDFEKLEIKPKILFLLISPLDLPPVKHLRTLSDLTRLIQLKNFSRALLEAENYQEFIKIIDLNSQSSTNSSIG